MATYNPTQNFQHYQLSLVNGQSIMMSSQVFNDPVQFQNFLNTFNAGGLRYVVNYIGSMPRIEDTKKHLDLSHESYEMSYEPDFTSQGNFTSTPGYPSANTAASHFHTPTQDDSATSVSGSGLNVNAQEFESPRASSTPTQAPAPQRPNPQSRLSFQEADTWDSVESGDGLELLCRAIDMTEGTLFGGMTIREHGKGYLLVPPDGHQDFGEKYYHNAWWMPSQQAWFFKQEHLDYFLDNGALWELDSETVEEIIAEAENTPYEQVFLDMIYEDFNGGYLVQCYEDHPFYQSQTYHGGVWNDQADGWYFPATQRDFLEDNGCEFMDNSRMVFEGMTFQPCRGRGFKLIPEVDNRFYGLQNFLGQGLWRKTYWFFPRGSNEYFTDRGAAFAM